MAGDWIKMRGNLWDDPRVSKLCDLTDQSEAAIVGALYWLWAAADQHTEDGLMPGLTLRQIDRKTGVQGFGAALCQIGWLEDNPDGVRIVNFEEHNGESAKRRSTDSKRKAVSRATAEPATKVQEGSSRRKGFTPAQKYQVFALDGFKCVYCGRHKDDPTPANLDKSKFCLSVDHLIPFSQGGDESEDNLVTACLPCNMAKNGRTPEEWGVVPDLSERLRTKAGQNTPNLGAREEKRREEDKAEEAPSPKSPRGTALPETWTLPDDWKTWAEKERPDVDPQTAADSFRDFWIAKPGKEGRKTDWQATWRNWVRNQRAPTFRKAAPAGDIWAGAVN